MSPKNITRSASELLAIREALVASPPNQWEVDMMQYRSQTGRYFFHVQLDMSVTVLALYDPGAEATLLNKEVYKRWGGRGKFPATPAPGSLTGAFGHASDTPLKCKIPLSAMGKKHLMKVFVTPGLNVDMIAGSDFVDQFGISLDAKRRRLVTDENIEVLAVNSEQIGPYESRLVECRLRPLKGSLPTQVVIESPGRPGSDIFVPPTLARQVSEGQTIKVPVWNWSPNTLDTRTVCSVVASARPARKAIPVNDLLIGELPMPPLTEVSDEKKAYLLKNLKTGEKVSEGTRKRLEEIVLRLHQAFGAHPYDLGRTRTYVHRVQLKNPQQAPIFAKQFRLPEIHRKAVEKEVEEMLKLGVLRPSKSAWNSAVFIVAKPSGGFRLVQDLRALNDATVENLHAGQTIEDLVQQVGELRADLFSTMDILKGFWQVPLHPDSQNLTSFSIPGKASYAWTSCPMGLKSSVFAFWSLVNAVTYGLSNSFCYMDDVLTASQGPDNHLKDLELLFRRMIQHKLTLNIEKCNFLQQRVHHLGFELSGEGVRPGQPKVEVLLKSPPPSTIKEIKAFLGLANFYYRHYPFQREAKYLSMLTRKESGWKGGALPPRAKEAVDNIKRMLTTRPLLRYPDYKRPFHLFCDAATGTANQMDDQQLDTPASGKPEEVQPGGIGCFLGQEDDQGKMYVIGFAGRGLKKNEASYSSYLLEHLSAVYALEQFDHIIRGYRCYLHTDHHPLTHLTNMHKKTLLRLQEMILERDVQITYTPGPSNGASDYISRIAYRVEQVEMMTETQEEDSLHMLPYSAQELKTLQRADPAIFELVNAVRKRHGWKCSDAARKWAANCFLSAQGVLFYREPRAKPPQVLLVIPEGLQREVIRAAHDTFCGGHGGVGQTQDRLRSCFFWPSLLMDAQEYVLSCDKCQKQKKSNYQGISQIIPLPAEKQFGGRVHLDLLGELPGAHKCKYILVITDAYSKLADFVALENKTAELVATRFFEEWVCRHSVPVIICTDGGKEFRNQFMQRLLEHLGVEHRATTPYHPQCNSQAEVLNKTAARYIRSFMDHAVSDPQPYLAALRFSYNTAVHRATGVSPFEIIYGRKPRYPYFDPEGQREMFYGEETADVLAQRAQLTRQLAEQNNMTFREAYTHRFNRDHNTPDYKEGQLVLLHAPLMTKRDLGVSIPKFGVPWAGPARIKKIFKEHHNALIEFPQGARRGRREFRVHFDRLKPYILRPGQRDPFQRAEEPSSTPEDQEAGTEGGRQSPLPTVSADDPLLEHLAQEEEDLVAWENLHNEDAAAAGGPRRLTVRFNPVAPSVQRPTADEADAALGQRAEPPEMVDLPRPATKTVVPRAAAPRASAPRAASRVWTRMRARLSRL